MKEKIRVNTREKKGRNIAYNAEINIRDRDVNRSDEINHVFYESRST